MKIKVKVHSNSSKEEIRKIDDESYEIWIKEKAEDNKANLAVTKLLKRFFKSDVDIKSGFNSRRKIAEVRY